MTFSMLRVSGPTAVGETPPRFRLFLPGAGPRADAVEQTVRLLGDHRYGAGSWVLEVVDIRADPDQARAAGVFLTPALHRLAPGPELRWFGDLSTTESLKQAFADAHV